MEHLWSDGPVLPQLLMYVVQTVTPPTVNTDDSNIDLDDDNNDDDIVYMAGSSHSSSSDSDID